MELLLLALLGIGTGAYGVLVGAGGGFILGPILLLFLDLEPDVVAAHCITISIFFVTLMH